MNKIRIGNKWVGDGEPSFIIAEAGVNYYDIAKKENIELLEAAKLMILEAENAGADAIKFQTYKADKLASKNSPAYWDRTKEPTSSQYKLFKKFDKFGEEEYRELAEYAKQKHIIFVQIIQNFNICHICVSALSVLIYYVMYEYKCALYVKIHIYAYLFFPIGCFS